MYLMQNLMFHQITVHLVHLNYHLLVKHLQMFILSRKDENYIGIVTTRAGVANTSDGLYFLGSGVSGIGSGLYNISSQHRSGYR